MSNLYLVGLYFQDKMFQQPYEHLLSFKYEPIVLHEALDNHQVSLKKQYMYCAVYSSGNRN